MRLALEDDLEVIGEVTDGSKALDLLIEKKPDVIVMDIEMPHMDGITATKAIQDLAPGVAVIVLSLYDDPHLKKQALEAGAKSYVEKRGGAVKLIEEIRRLIDIKPGS